MNRLDFCGQRSRLLWPHMCPSLVNTIYLGHLDAISSNSHWPKCQCEHLGQKPPENRQIIWLFFIQYYLGKLHFHRLASMECFCPLCHAVWFLVFLIITSFKSSSIFIFQQFFLCKAFLKSTLCSLVYITNHHVILITLLHPAEPPQNRCLAQ